MHKAATHTQAQGQGQVQGQGPAYTSYYRNAAAATSHGALYTYGTWNQAPAHVQPLHTKQEPVYQQQYVHTHTHAQAQTQAQLPPVPASASASASYRYNAAMQITAPI